MTGDTKDEAEGHNEDPLQEDGHESGLKDGVEEEPKKKKFMTRLLTARLDKLVAKKDDACVVAFLAFFCVSSEHIVCSGNTLSNDFMELPSKKIWAIYYKTISRPMSFEKIYVRSFMFYYRWLQLNFHPETPQAQRILKCCPVCARC
jgi:hypothetical protein